MWEIFWNIFLNDSVILCKTSAPKDSTWCKGSLTFAVCLSKMVATGETAPKHSECEYSQ